ncbi:MAG: hypothetical protein HY084_08200 [Gemmatimonadetes bacterium]|nr:hypothetical protein [Gemmatimonadota bacterium]
MRSFDPRSRAFIVVIAASLVATPLAAQTVGRGIRKAPAAPIAAPATFTAARMNDGIQLNWAVVDGATGYLLWRTPLPNGKEELIGNLPTGKSNAFFDGEWKTTRESVQYRVQVVDAEGKRGPSTTVTYVPPIEKKLVAPLTKKP